MNELETVTQYAQYTLPDWAPPSWVFGPVWTVLYLIIGITFGYIIYKYLKGKVGWNIMTPLVINVISNLAFTPIQFGLMNMTLASIDILIVLGSLIWFMLAVWKKYRWVALANIPYLAWVSFATVLQLTILSLNS